MSSPLRDRGQFVLAAAALGTVFGVLNVVYTRDWGWALAVLMAPALIVRVFWRTMPGWLLLAWVLAPTVIGDALVVTQTAYMVVIIAIAVVAADGPRRADLVVLALGLISPFFIWALETSNWHRGIGAWLWLGGMLIGWGFGYVVGRQWQLIHELEQTRTRLAESAVAADRQRIARDLHDQVGHSFTVVLLHLSGARLNLATSPADAEAALRQAEAVGRTGMEELRQALMLMQRGTTPRVPVDAKELELLFGRYREAGMSIDLDVSGDLDGISAAPRIVLHDVLREALTNVAKHAGEPQATVRIEVTRSQVAVRVENTLGSHPAAARSGMGLPGLEHRVAAIDGSFDARPDQGHWVVRAQLPRRLAGAAA